MRKQESYPLFFSLLLFFKHSWCLDPSYESCVPKDCGDGRNITYPFYINGLQDPSCGYPGFKLTCNNNGSSILHISGNDLVVKHIGYENRSLRLAINQSCGSKIRNMTLDPNRFSIDMITHHHLVWISNCSGNLSADLDKYRVGSCDRSRSKEFVMVENDANLKRVKEAGGCGEVVVTTPVELADGEVVVDGSNYKEVVERGFVMQWRAADCGTCADTGGRCGFDMEDFQFRCFCPDRPDKIRCQPDKGRKLSLMIVVLGCVGGVTMSLIIILYLKRTILWRKMENYNVNMELFIKNQEFLAPKRYSYSQIKKMTSSFKVKLGQGGFGSVYKGVLSDHKLVAVKVLSELKGNGEDFINEVASVGRTSHVNIVSLVGFCLEGRRRALIYEFMPNGSLERFIYGRVPLSSSQQLGWEKLHQIATGIARGLEYLHRDCNTRILHFDIKPHNILLDNDFCPKISDFGLAKLLHEKESKISMSHMRGTPGYIAPELFSRNFGQVSHKSDVYSYGMMILEMVGGRRNIEIGVDHTSEIYFPQWIYRKVELHENLGLHGIVSDEENRIARKMIIVGLWCIQTNPLSRPTITEVLEMLEEDLDKLEIPPKPYLYSPSRSVRSPSADSLHPYSSSINTL